MIDVVRLTVIASRATASLKVRTIETGRAGRISPWTGDEATSEACANARLGPIITKRDMRAATQKRIAA
jgi:putative SOS response-associated peptidase YedK